MVAWLGEGGVWTWTTSSPSAASGFHLCSLILHAFTCSQEQATLKTLL